MLGPKEPGGDQKSLHLCPQAFAKHSRSVHDASAECSLVSRLGWASLGVVAFEPLSSEWKVESEAQWERSVQSEEESGGAESGVETGT